MLRRSVPLALIAIVLSVAACDGDEADDPTPVDSAPASEAGGDGVQGASSRLARLSRVGSFDSPTYVASPPGDGRRLFVVEQRGRVVLLVDGKRRSRPFLDVRGDVSCCGERGLLSIAFAPDYADSGRLYLYFTGRNGDIRVQQVRRSRSSPDVADSGTRRDVIRIGHSRFPNHNGGQLQFGRDGMLYVGTGDGGGGGDTLGSGQRLDVLLAKLLRIDPRAGGGYDVPADNPFRGRSGARGEVWSYGLRNPYRFAFDRKTGDLTIGDVGQDKWDEVDFVAAGDGAGRGANFGWNRFEGRERFASGTAPGHVPPVLVSRLHSGGNCALIGGHVVRDRSLEGLYGRYLYGDNCNPTIYSVKLTASGASGRKATGLRVGGLSSFGQDGLGRIYMTSLGGAVYRLVPR
ncbi:MAG TPA: PQQ-dependent sugar dehydrogenase [Thermoleophilaceae bacterium]|jgi:glucose/arabinose dehydrogenase